MTLSPEVLAVLRRRHPKIEMGRAACTGGRWEVHVFCLETWHRGLLTMPNSSPEETFITWEYAWK